MKKPEVIILKTESTPGDDLEKLWFSDYAFCDFTFVGFDHIEDYKHININQIFEKHKAKSLNVHRFNNYFLEANGYCESIDYKLVVISDKHKEFDSVKRRITIQKILTDE